MAMADEGRHYNEHDDRVGGPAFRSKKGRGPFRGRMYSEQPPRQRHRGGGGWGPGPRARFDEDEGGDVSMNDTLQDSSPGSGQRRFNPYSVRPNRRGEDRFNRDRERGGGQRGPRGAANRKSWFKITIPCGKKYDKPWLIAALQGVCSLQFTPVHFHYEKNNAVFFVEDATTANALKMVSRKITDKDSYKVVVIINSSSSPPSFILNELKPEELEQLKQCMSKRFDGSQQALDLNSLRTDPDLVTHNIDLVLNRRNCMQAVNKVIEENIPELVSLNLSNNRLYRLDDLSELVNKAPKLKSLNLSRNELKTERELDKIKGFQLEELWLDRNALCDSFKDHSTYISAVRERFSKLLRLDGHILPLPIAFDVEAPTTLPPGKGSYFGSDDIKSLILRFLQQYYSVYDSADRQPLLDAYHDGASFSLTVPFTTQNPSRSSLGEYQKDSRNVKKLSNPAARFRLLKHTRLMVVAFLNELPKTQHDVSSFVVDVSACTNTLLSFTVAGVFKEVDGKARDSVRAFSRVFVTVPAGNTGLCIVNDELFVRNASTEEIRRAFATPAPTPSSSPVPSLSAPQQEMLSAFSLQSGMNLEWTQKCLQDNEWDFNRAAQIFTQLKAEGKIPDVAFVK